MLSCLSCACDTYNDILYMLVYKVIQSNLGCRTLLFSTKSVFEQKIQDFYILYLEHKFGPRPNRANANRLIAYSHRFNAR